MSASFSEKTVLVTGASRGIGRAIADLFIEQGAYVIGTATSESVANSLSEHFAGKGKGLVLNQACNDSIASFSEALSDGNTLKY